MPTARTRILIVDDHPVVRGGLLRLLAQEPDLECCGEASGATEAFDLACRQKPDLAIIDLRLRQGDGLELIKSLRAELPRLRLLVLSQHNEPLYLERALRAGALGYVAKEQDPAEVLTAIRTILAGQVYVTRGMAAHLLQSFVGLPGQGAPSGISQLTDRELAVLHLLGEGFSTRDIAANLHVSFKTVESHRENIKRKLNLQNAAELVHFAIRWVAEPAPLPAEAVNQALRKPPRPEKQQ